MPRWFWRRRRSSSSEDLRSREIDQILQNSKEEDESCIKIVCYGRMAGVTTFLRACSMPDQMDAECLKAHLPEMTANLILGLQALCRRTLDKRKDTKIDSVDIKNRWIRDKVLDLCGDEDVDEALAQALCSLSRDAGMREALHEMTGRCPFAVGRNLPSFLARLDQILSADFVPSRKDALSVWVPHAHVTAYEACLEGFHLHMYDASRVNPVQRHKKLWHFFENCDFCFFFSDLSSYFQAPRHAVEGESRRAQPYAFWTPPAEFFSARAKVDLEAKRKREMLAGTRIRKPPLDWSCELCTFLNPPRVRACAMCENARPEPAPRPRRSSSQYSGDLLSDAAPATTALQDDLREFSSLTSKFLKSGEAQTHKIRTVVLLTGLDLLERNLWRQPLHRSCPDFSTDFPGIEEGDAVGYIKSLFREVAGDDVEIYSLDATDVDSVRGTITRILNTA